MPTVALNSKSALAGAGPSNLKVRPGDRKKAGKKGPHASKTRRVHDRKELQTLEDAVKNFTLPEGSRAFADLPISPHTKKGLKKASYVQMTDIQSLSLPPSLKGQDILGAARTGSGKTLAFLIPVLEILHRRKWGPQDGLGALIISPTRELAMQIFDVLRAIGGYHPFSAGLVIGGKNLKDEKDRLSKMNILVATPGRLLQHMDQTIGFECDNLQILVLDEADRILDMGFSKTINAIVQHLPPGRQTLLFSATQTSSIQDLARLSLLAPQTISTYDSNSTSSTPSNLTQHYLLCPLPQKLDTLFSFIKSHLQSKALVFLSSCKQVQFVFETFCKLQPGVPLLHLHGKQKPRARLDIFTRFTSTRRAFLFATDLAARGLDFPSIDWVIQLDAPEDPETYIHRVGRTARYEAKGQSLLFLCPSEEEGMVEALKGVNVDVAKIKVKENKQMSIRNSLQSYAFQDPAVKYLAQRAFVSYMRSVYLQKNKAIFDVSALPLQEFAESLGLAGAPKIKFVGRELAKKRKNASRDSAAVVAKDDRSGSGGGSSDEEGGGDGDKSTIEKDAGTKVRTKYDRMFERKNQSVLSSHYTALIDQSSDSDADEFISLKRANHDLDIPSLPSSSNLSNRQLKAGQSKRQMLKYKGAPSKLVFDDEGEGHEVYEMKDDEEFRTGGVDVREEGRKFAEVQRMKMGVADVVDKEEAKGKKRERKEKKKRAARGQESDGNDDEDGGAAIAPPSDDDGYVSPDFGFTDTDTDEEQEDQARPLKRARRDAPPPTSTRLARLEEEEALALQMLGRKRA